MKKILLILMVMLTIFMTGCFGQNTNTITTMETKSYDITYVDNSYYDFNTGSYYVSDGVDRTYYDSYATTNRISLASDTITLSATNYNYIFFWDKNNNYLGYQRSATGVHELSRYLGVAATPIVPPTGAKKFALMAKTGWGYLSNNNADYLDSLMSIQVYDESMPNSNLDFKSFFEDTLIPNETTDLLPFNQPDYTEGYSLSITGNQITIDGYIDVDTRISLYHNLYIYTPYAINATDITYISGSDSRTPDGVVVGVELYGGTSYPPTATYQLIYDNDTFDPVFWVQEINYYVTAGTTFDNYVFEIELWSSQFIGDEMISDRILVQPNSFVINSHDYDFSAFFTDNSVTLNGTSTAGMDLLLSDSGYVTTDNFYLEYIAPETGGSFPGYTVLPKLYDNDALAYDNLFTDDIPAGDYGDLILYIDAGSEFDNDTFEINAYSYYNLRTIDEPVYEGLSLRDIFEDTSLFDSEQLVTNGDFSDGTIGWSLTTATGSVTSGVYSFTATNENGRVEQEYMNTISNDKHYFVANIKSDSNLVLLRTTPSIYTKNHSGSGNFELLSTIGILSNDFAYNYITIRDERTSGWTQIDVDFIYIFNISTLIANKQYSPLYDDTFDNMSDVYIQTQMDYWVLYPEQFIDYSLFTTAPTQSQLDEWLEQYLACGNDFNADILIPYYFENYNYTLTEAEFEYWQQLYYDYVFTIDRYEWYNDTGFITATNYDFWRAEYELWKGVNADFHLYSTFDDITSDYTVSVPVSTDIDDNLDNGIEAFGLGNFGRFLILFVIIGAISLLLGLIHVPYSMILLVDILLFMTSFLLDWIPAWLGIITVIVLFITLITVVIRRN